ncbi:hypothetical protein SAMN05444320_105347 [Streptoalloteichus hindustanus]|uniref:Uncharacterized protein n=1 Tax=Streptoalloteichus hindustanus TaxID=2017 RepID=A0A1M5FAF4_STRHI|nr:hypothetical protein SAMN05444320_105347 [Streptoalloteichus hindustanus]
MRGDEEDHVGLVLCPADDDTDSPDISWSYNRFDVFRRRLAQAGGFTLSEMRGFGGERPWDSVSTTLEPLLDHPDDDGTLTPAQCAAILPRLEAIADQWRQCDNDPLLKPYVDDALQLVTVLRCGVDKNVDLLFAQIAGDWLGLTGRRWSGRPRRRRRGRRTPPVPWR